MKITCPRCGMTSHHPMDVKQGYCANCHDWTTPRQELMTVDTKEEVVAKICEFLALSERFPDSAPMWVTGGICLTWGDLRILANYQESKEK